nr:carbohydrate porin [Acinetobacter qingfengensis]
MAILGSTLLLSSEVMANEPWSQDRQWLLGDWNGKRQQLEDLGYRFNLSIMNQTATILDGGKSNHQTRNANQLGLGVNFDLSKIADWKNTTAALTITKRDGRNLASDIGMNGSPTEIYGRGNIWRLTQAWIKSGFIDNTLQIKIGRMGMSEDFNGSHCEFQSLILCGGQVGKSQGDVWYNGPVSGWAMNAKYHFSPEWSIAAGVYENNPENLRTDKKANFNLDTSAGKGVLVPVELAWKTQRMNGLTGEYKLGGFYTTHDYANVDDSNATDPKRAVWLNMQQQLTVNNTNPKGGLYAAINLVFNDTSTTSNVSSTQQIVLWYKAPFTSRPNDQIGFGMGRYQFNDKVASNTDRDAETDVELNYVYQYSPALMIRPNLQYVNKPNGLSTIDNAWVAGISVGLKF